MWDFESVYLVFFHIVGKWSLNSLIQHDINPAQKTYTQQMISEQLVMHFSDENKSFNLKGRESNFDVGTFTKCLG